MFPRFRHSLTLRALGAGLADDWALHVPHSDSVVDIDYILHRHRPAFTSPMHFVLCPTLLSHPFGVNHAIDCRRRLPTQTIVKDARLASPGNIPDFE